MVASAFHHRLHVVQLGVMPRLIGEDTFARVADRWESYARSRTKRLQALLLLEPMGFDVSDPG
jgi:hypothetical protein